MPSFNLKNLTVIIVLLLLAVLGGFLIGRSNLIPTSTSSVKISPLFNSQTALINGSVDKVENSKATVRRKHLTETFPLSAQFIIYKYASSSAQSTNSTNTADIEPTKSATIVLEVIDSEYYINSITYSAN